MVSVGARKSHSPCKRLCNKCRLCVASNLSLDTTALSIQTGGGVSYENTPSPSSTASTTTIERLPKSPRGILSSTLKNDHHFHVSFKRRSRYEKLFYRTQLVNRQYMLTMTNILYQMHKEIYKLKKRTHRMEQKVVKQTKVTQPIIRIPRLTKDQLSSIYVDDNNNENDTTEENELISDEQNIISVVEPTKPKKLKKDKHKSVKYALKLSKKHRRAIWINNRQKAIDPNRYCSFCRREFSKRSNFLAHVRNVHKGRLPPLINEQDQSLLQMNAENTNESFHEGNDNRSHELTHDQSVVVVVPNDETEPSQTLVNPINVSEGRLRPRSVAKSVHEPVNRDKVKCDICNKFFRASYLKKHKQGAHRDQQIFSSSSLEINNNCDQFGYTAEKSTGKRHLSTEISRSIAEIDPRKAATPTTITIAEMETDDEPIRFRTDSTKPIVIAVTCLEGYQLELVEKFLEKFALYACQKSSIDSQTTHLIANDEQHLLRSPLSMKLIEAIAHHCFCVSYRWIIDCLKYDRIVDERSYEIEGDDTDVHPHGGPRRSRSIASRHSLFENICFMIKCTENSGIQMTNERLEDLITSCGGQIITCVTQRLLDRFQIIVLCDMSYVSERRHNYDQCRQLGIHFVSSDWVLESILEYRKKPFSLFEEVPL